MSRVVMPYKSFTAFGCFHVYVVNIVYLISGVVDLALTPQCALVNSH